MVTIKDIANEANVSTTTVSRVLNNKPDVSDKTKVKIMKIVDELGYNPNSIARGLVLQKSYTIGLIIPDISNPFFPEIVRGVENQAKKLGYSVIFYNTDNNKEEEKKAIQLLKSKQVDGLILSLSMGNKKELFTLEKEEFPVVQIDRQIPNAKSPTITIDNQLSAYKATSYLIKMGHTRIAHITGDLETETGQQRLKGFKKALSEFSIPLHGNWILKGDFSKKSGYIQMNKILKQKNRPTSIFAANDFMAIGCYEAIYDNGLEIPKDISIVGHDDVYVSSLIRPGLNTMVQPKLELGKIAVKILIRKIENSKIDNNHECILESYLKIRNSVKELAGNG